MLMEGVSVHPLPGSYRYLRFTKRSWRNVESMVTNFWVTDQSSLTGRNFNQTQATAIVRNRPQLKCPS